MGPYANLLLLYTIDNVVSNKENKVYLIMNKDISEKVPLKHVMQIDLQNRKYKLRE